MLIDLWGGKWETDGFGCSGNTPLIVWLREIDWLHTMGLNGYCYYLYSHSKMSDTTSFSSTSPASSFYSTSEEWEGEGEEGERNKKQAAGDIIWRTWKRFVARSVLLHNVPILRAAGIDVVEDYWHPQLSIGWDWHGVMSDVALVLRGWEWDVSSNSDTSPSPAL